jgi:predicted amidohydrolase
MMLPAYSLVAQGTQIHIAAFPFAVQRGRGYSLLLSKALAVQGCCYVIAVGSVFKKEAVPADFIELETAGWDQDEGGSCIIAPDGALLAEAETGKEVIITARGSLDTVLQHKSARDISGHYSRPDVLQLQINHRPLERLVRLDTIDRSMASSSANIALSDVEGGNKQETKK